MKNAFQTSLAFGLLTAGAAFGFEGYPQAERVEPRTAKVGTVLTISGRALNKEMVDEVFLTDHRFDMKVKVIEQTENFLKIRIPPFAKPGRLQVLLLTAGDKPAYLEQPLYVTVEEAPAEPVAAPVEVTRQAEQPRSAPKKKTVEIASLGNNIPVPASTFAAAPVSQPVQAPAKREEPPVAVQPPPAAVPVAPAPGSAAVAKSVTQPRLIKRTPVVMPASSPSMGGDAGVELLVRIGVDGKVGNVKVVKGNPMYAQAAVRSVRDWVYESAYVGSTPVAADVSITLNFKR